MYIRVCNLKKAVSKIRAPRNQKINAWIHAVVTFDHFYEFKNLKNQFYVFLL